MDHNPWQLILSSCLLLLVSIVSCWQPEDPIKCTSEYTNCTISNAYGSFPDRSICQAANVVYPSSEEELVTVIAHATKAKQKIKVATRYSHSVPKLVCPYGKEGLLISTNKLNRILEVNVQSMTMTVESGVMLRQFMDEAAKAKLALPYTPYWWGVTIGGLLSTGAHGSTLLGKGSTVHDYVVAMTVISPGGPEDGYVKVRNLDEKNGDLNAAKVSLGVLGVISKVTIQLQPLFKRSITYVKKNDNDLGDQALTFGLQHEFADITWYPNQQKAIYRIDDRISSHTSGNGLYDFFAFGNSPISTLESNRRKEEELQASGDAKETCEAAKQTTTSLLSVGYGLTNDGTVLTGYPVIGYQNRLQASGSCLDNPENKSVTCSWDPRIKGSFFFQSAFSIGLSVVKNFIQDIQKLAKLKPGALCVLEQNNGILLRYVKASTAYLGKEEDSIDFDMPYYRSRDPKNPRLFEDVIEEIEQMAVFKYGALPHWGKNRNVAFIGVIKKHKKAREFLRVKLKYDPNGLFSNEWTDQILGLKGEVSIVKEGCALEGLCICSEDIHCAPEKGYFCKPGRVYKSARVCTLV